MDVLEIIKTLGSFAELLTGVVLFYDRLAKGRPVAYLSFKENEDRSAYLRVENPSTYGIAILGIAVRPEVFGIAEDLEPRSLLRAAAGSTVSLVLAPGVGKDLS